MTPTNQGYKIKWELEQRSEQWYRDREGEITGSKSALAQTSGDTIVYKLLAELCAISDDEDNAYTSKKMQRGKDKEPEAVTAYVKKTGNVVKHAGIIKGIGELAGLSHSPDGLVMRSEESIKRVLEVKAKDAHSHLRIVLTKKIPKEHRAQCIHALVVAYDAEAVDFISYDDRVVNKPLVIVTLYRKDCEVEIAAAKRRYAEILRELSEKYAEIIK